MLEDSVGRERGCLRGGTANSKGNMGKKGRHGRETQTLEVQLETFQVIDNLRLEQNP